MDQGIQAAVRDLITQHAASDSAVDRLVAAEYVKNEIADVLDLDQWNTAVTAVAEGTSQPKLGERLDLSRWAVAKRWPNLSQFGRKQRWWYLNALTWVDAVDDLVTAERYAAMDTLLPEDEQRSIDLLISLCGHYRKSGTWTQLPITREYVDKLLAHAPSEDADHQKARDWIAALLSDWDQTHAGHKGPELGITRDAIVAATQDRINRESRALGGQNGKSRQDPAHKKR